MPVMSDSESGDSYSPQPSKKRKTTPKRQAMPKVLEPCLICSKKDANRNSELFVFSGSNGFPPLNCQLWNTFVMRKLLKLPVCKYEEILKLVGSSINPSDWFVVCNICSDAINEILDVQENIMILERRVSKMKALFVKKCVDNVRTLGRKRSKGMLNIRNEIRAFVKDSLVKPLPDEAIGVGMDNTRPKNEIPDVQLEEELDMDDFQPFSETTEPMNQDTSDFNSVGNGKEMEVINEEFDEEWLPQTSPLSKEKSTTVVNSKKVKPEKPINVTHKCGRCGLKFKTETTYEDHLKAHENTPANLHCDKCHRPYPDEETLRKHLQRVHKVAIGNCICELCGFDAKKLHTLKQHLLKHKIFDGSVDPSISTTHFVCTICKNIFKTRKILSLHRVTNHHAELGIDVLKCTDADCSKVFLRKSCLLDHVAHNHGGTHRLQCEKCGYRTSNKHSLQTHMESHQETQHICEYCSATYLYNTGLRGHMKKVHPDKYQPKKVNFFHGVQVEKLDNEYGHGLLPMGATGFEEPAKDYPCKYCAAKFQHKFALKNHLKSAHEDMYSFNCELCERVYMSEQSLKLHKKINHGGNTKVACGWCHKTVSHRINLYDHKKYCPKRPKGSDVPKILTLEDNSSSAGISQNVHSSETADVPV